MNQKFPVLIVLCCCLILSVFEVSAQDDKKEEIQKKEKEIQKKEKEVQKKEKEIRKKKDKESQKKDKEKKDQEYKYDKKDEQEKNNTEYKKDSQASRQGKVIGRVILPKKGTNSPRKLKGVPKGHYPPPGSCRIWYPNRPPGHQPPPESCSSLSRVALEPGAFILHGDSAYDADYDWKEKERRRPGTVSRDILDISLPKRKQ